MTNTSIPSDSEIERLVALAEPIARKMASDTGSPLARSMMDRLMSPVLTDLAVYVARASGGPLDCERLSRCLGLPRSALDELVAAMTGGRP